MSVMGETSTKAKYAATSFWKMARLILDLKMRVYLMIIHVLGKMQCPTLTGDLHDEYFKNMLNVPISLKITNSQKMR